MPNNSITFNATQQELEWLTARWASQYILSDPHYFVYTEGSFETAIERLTALAAVIGKERVDEIVDLVGKKLLPDVPSDDDEGWKS